MSIDNNISLVRSNTVSTAFDSGDVNENTVNAYANLFYPYILDNGGNKQNVSLTIDILNKKGLEQNTKNFPNRNWINKDRLNADLSNSQAIWGFKEAYHAKKASRSLSNAIVFSGQELSFYIAPQGHGTGYINDKWAYCKTRIVVTAIDVINGTSIILTDFSDFQVEENSSNRYFKYVVPSLNNDLFNNYGLFGLNIIRIEVEQTYYKDARLTMLLDQVVPYKNQSSLQLLIYSGAKEAIEVNAGVVNILTQIPSYSDTLEDIFAKTTLNTLQNLNQNSLTAAQKRAIIADQMAVLFMSQHPVITADNYPGKAIGWGAQQSITPLKVINNIITYVKQNPDLVPIIRDRLFGMLVTYKSFNYTFDIEKIITDFNQSTQIIRDPVRTIYIDSNNVLNNDMSVDGIVFNPYILNTTNAEIINVTDSSPISINLSNKLIDIQNITITNPFNLPLVPYSNRAKVSFEVVSGVNNISQIKYSIFTQNALNYQFYVDDTGLSRSYVFNLDSPIVAKPINNGDIVTVQIDIEALDGSVSSFINTVNVSGYLTAPFLTDLKLFQRRDGSRVVELDYIYSSNLGEINDGYIYFQVSIDGGITWSKVSTSSVKGDVGNISTGFKKITWLPEVDLANSTLSKPILVRLTLYDTDINKAQGDSLTGALVMNINKPDILLVKSVED